MFQILNTLASALCCPVLFDICVSPCCLCQLQDWATSVYDVCQWSVDPTLAPGSELVNPDDLIAVDFVSDITVTVAIPLHR